MILLYTNHIINDQAILDKDEFRHCVKTLRKKTGDQVWFTDGLGSIYESGLIRIEKDRAILQIHRTIEKTGLQPQLHVAISPVKQLSRFEWFVEKSTELGISDITPLICHRSEKRKINLDRTEKITISAMKQSLRAKLPVVHKPVGFIEFLKGLDNSLQVFIAHYQEGQPAFHTQVNPLVDTTVLIGPEGDFTNDELALANQHGIQSVNLGEYRLRTETAGVLACAQFVR